MLVLAFFLIHALAHAQQVTQSVRASASEVSKLVERLGIDLTGMTTVTRAFDSTYPVSHSPHVSITNRYGPVQVSTWDNAVVRVRATMIVGAKEIDLAEAFAEAITIEVDNESERIAITTAYPSVRIKGEIGGYGVEYEVFIPRDASLEVRNDWGDTRVQGVGGPLTLHSSFGAVELHDLGGFVRVIASGEEDRLVADGLRRGGFFLMRGAESFFTDVSGTLSVKSHFGSVTVHSPGEVVDMDIRSEGGPIHFYVPVDGHPDIEARAIDGTIESDLIMDIDAWAGSTYGQLLNVDATQRIFLVAGLDTIYIHSEDAAPPEVLSITEATGQTVQSPLEATYPAPQGSRLVIEASVGDVRIEGIEGDKVILTATKSVVVNSLDDAKAAMDALTLQSRPEGDLLHIRTVVKGDMEMLGCQTYRVDLVIQCPYTLPLDIYAKDGHTYITRIHAPILVEQIQGTVTVTQCTGALQLSNAKGDIEVDSAEGSVDVSGSFGTVSLKHVAGNINVQYSDGTTVIDSPRAGVRVRNPSGDIRILALEGILGEYDISTEQGTISMMKPDSADATFWLETQGGTIYPSMTMTGIIGRDSQSLRGVLNQGTHRVALSARGGNIILD